uniref:Uncharacterized protein n=1 Tax=Brassica oleracea var. oleracea TaxID=109376 RepID=A0A0D3CKE6_BRAOL
MVKTRSRGGLRRGKSVRQTKVRIREVEAPTAPSPPAFLREMEAYSALSPPVVSLGRGGSHSSAVAGFCFRRVEALKALRCRLDWMRSCEMLKLFIPEWANPSDGITYFGLRSVSVVMSMDHYMEPAQHGVQDVLNISTEVHVFHRTRLDLDHARLDVDHARLNEDHARLDLDHARLDVDHARLNEDHARLDLDHARLDVDHARLNEDHARLDLDHARLDKQRNRRKRQNKFDDDEKWIRSGDCPFTKAKRSNRDVSDQNELQTYASWEKMLHKAIHVVRQLKKKGNTNTSSAPKQQSCENHKQSSFYQVLQMPYGRSLCQQVPKTETLVTLEKIETEPEKEDPLPIFDDYADEPKEGSGGEQNCVHKEGSSSIHKLDRTQDLRTNLFEEEGNDVPQSTDHYMEPA